MVVGVSASACSSVSSCASSTTITSNVLPRATALVRVLNSMEPPLAKLTLSLPWARLIDSLPSSLAKSGTPSTKFRISLNISLVVLPWWAVYNTCLPSTAAIQRA